MDDLATLLALGEDSTGERAVERAAALLADGAFVAEALSDPRARLREARERHAAFERETRAAFSRYPVTRSGGFHSGDADNRAYPLFATLSYLRQAGLYVPEDLDRMVAAGEVTEEWAAGEALRLEACLAALRIPIGQLDDAAIQPQAYRTAVEELVRRFAAMRIAR